MQTKIEKTLLFSITVVFCFGISIASATELSAVDISAPSTERADVAPKDTAMNKENHFNGSELEMNQAADRCNDGQPCQNGGTCGWYGLCDCPHGITGDYCEKIVACSSMCYNRLEVDCLYNADERVVYCSCKNSSLFYDQEAHICKPCECENGYCDYEYAYSDRKLVCRCPHGYKEFNGYCKECECGFNRNGFCELDPKGEKICDCLDGFYEREGRCVACECTSTSDLHTKCEVRDGVKHCFCPEEYKEVDGLCDLPESNSCEKNNTCHPTANCLNVYRDIECECPDGYKGIYGRTVEPGEVCKDIDECFEFTSPCWYYDGVRCVNLPGSYKCECLPGYEPGSYLDEPQRTICNKASKKALPVIIVVIVTLVLFIVSCMVHCYVKKRATRAS